MGYLLTWSVYHTYVGNGPMIVIININILPIHALIFLF